MQFIGEAAGQLGFAGARLPGDEQRLPQGQGDIDGAAQFVRGDVEGGIIQINEGLVIGKFLPPVRDWHPLALV